MKQLMIINDLCGYSTVATTAMLPILSYMGIPTTTLPTAIISINLEYGKFAILETTDYIQQSFRVWKDLGFHSDAIATGFMASERQAEIVAAHCREQAALGTHIYVDPIMGDEGSLYNGITSATVSAMRRMLSVAHLCFPNYTEACYITGTAYNAQGITMTEAVELVDKLHAIGSESVIITSIPIDGQMSVIGFDATKASAITSDTVFILTYDEIPTRIPGTGDIFSAIVIGHLLKDVPLIDSTARAMRSVRRLIDINKDSQDKFRGIPIERHLAELE